MSLADVFLDPQNTTHRQYEALRAYFVDKRPGPEVARQFGYTLGSLHQLIHQFRREPKRTFFLEPDGPGRKAEGRVKDTVKPKPDAAVRQRIVELRKQNLSMAPRKGHFLRH